MPTWYTNNFFTLTQSLDLQIDFLYGFFESEYRYSGKNKCSRCFLRHKMWRKFSCEVTAFISLFIICSMWRTTEKYNQGLLGEENSESSSRVPLHYV